jgi:hypothetical protein
MIILREEIGSGSTVGRNFAHLVPGAIIHLLETNAP